MVVFGFGRGAGTKALLRTPQEFIITLLDSRAPDAASHASIATHLSRLLKP
jgi:hypothetical protein